MSRAFSQWRCFVETHRQKEISTDHRPRAPGFSLFSTERRSISPFDREQTAPQETDAWEFREENEADEDDHILLLDGAGRVPTTETALENSNDQREAAINAPLPGVVRSSSGILKRSGKAGGSLKRVRLSWKTHELVEDPSTKDSAHETPECDQLPEVGASDGNGTPNESPKKRKYHDEDNSDQETYTPTAENRGGSADDASTEGTDQAEEQKDDDDIAAETPQISSKENESQPTRRAKRRKGLLADLDMDGPRSMPSSLSV